MFHVAPGVELPFLVGDTEGDAARDHHPELLAHVVMLRDECPGAELDHRQRRLLAVHLARDDVVPDPQRPNGLDLLERAHLRTG